MCKHSGPVALIWPDGRRRQTDAVEVELEVQEGRWGPMEQR